MSRIAKVPIVIPDNVDVKINNQTITIKSNNAKLTCCLHYLVNVNYSNNMLCFKSNINCKEGWAQAGTARSIVNGMVIGVTTGFTKRLQLVGVGYRVSIKHDIIYLSLGFSHQIEYKLPIDITAECPSQTEILLKGFDKQMIGQVAADLRSYRPPEPYKGKGIRYIDEIVRSKNSKKK